jgi:D-alanyl-D-alanine carboxypeptidase (penicillin-binding protein 5/6)
MPREYEASFHPGSALGRCGAAHPGGCHERARRQLKATAVFDGPLAAPVAAGQVVGKLRLEAPGVRPTEVPLIAISGVEPLGAFDSMIAAAEHLIWG